MNHIDADALAKRIINTWRGGPPLTEWIDVLTDLDTGTAGTAFIRLRNDTDHTPTIAKYLATYRTLHTPANDPIASDCPHCNGTGWVTAPDLDYAGNTCLQPCTCPAGRQAETAHRKIDDHRRQHRQGPYQPQTTPRERTLHLVPLPDPEDF